MSATRQALDTAIQAYAQAEWDGELVVDWVLIAATVDEDGDHGIGTETSRENMPRLRSRRTTPRRTPTGRRNR